MITMLRLIGIKIDAKLAEADFIPENSQDIGHIVVDLTTEKVVDYEAVPGYGASYRAHARQRLVRMAKEGDTCSECVVMWY